MKKVWDAHDPSEHGDHGRRGGGRQRLATANCG
jgi:hypothetical protein